MTQHEEKLSKLNVPHKRVYVGGLGYKGVQGMNSTEANYPPFEMLGLKNALFEDKEAMGHHFVDFEALLRANPEMIFIDTFGKTKIAQEYTAQKPLFDTLNAYKMGNVKEVLGYNFYSTNIENLLVIAYQIAFHMGVSVDVNREAKAIYEAFYGKSGVALLEQLPYGLK
jgi:iron complex transport system substrate-binding protein